MLVGNDLVDLSDFDSDPATRHPRFDARVFAPVELSAIHDAGDQNRLRWSLWAAKEAAYKVARKLDPAAIFSPVRFATALDRAGRGHVTHSSGLYSVRVSETDGVVHAIAHPPQSEGATLLCGLRRLADDEDASPRGLSQAVRGLVKAALAARLDVAPEEFELRREGRIPRLWLNAEPAPFDLSLSHHGRAIGFVAAGVAQ